MSLIGAQKKIAAGLAVLACAGAVVGGVISGDHGPNESALQHFIPPADGENASVSAVTQQQGILGAGLANGRLPSSALARIAGGYSLNHSAAAAWNAMQLATHHYLRAPPFIPNGEGAAYRTFAQQQYWRSYWCGLGACYNAAVPGYSNHGWGRAVDMPCSLRWYVDSVGGWFGIRWGEAPGECWHVTYYGGFHRPDPGPSLLYPVLRHGSGGYGQSFEVHYVQALLHAHGISVAWSHGYFTAGTASAVKALQRRRHLRADGTVNKSTWIALRSAKR